MLTGGLATASAGSSSRKRPHRKPGYMRAELPRPQNTSTGGGGTTTCLTKEASGCSSIDNHNDITKPLAAKSSSGIQQQPATEKYSPAHCQKSKAFLSMSPTPCLRQEDCCITKCMSSPQTNTKPQSYLRLTSESSLQPCPTESRFSPSGDTFSSSFSFIQQSLSSSQRSEAATNVHSPILDPESVDQTLPITLTSRPGFAPPAHLGPGSVSSDHSPSKTPGSSMSRQGEVGQPFSKLLITVQSDSNSASLVQSDKVQELSLGEKFWQDRHWEGKVVVGYPSVTSDLRQSLPDSDSYSLDTEATSSLSVDSDAASASSVTSGYESATPASDQGWDKLVKKYECVLQDCLQNNHSNTKVRTIRPHQGIWVS